MMRDQSGGQMIGGGPVSGGQICEGGPPAIPFERRKQLIALANHVAETITTKVERHERFMFRRLLDTLSGE